LCAASLRYIQVHNPRYYSDAMMPMVDGFATLEQIKQDKRLQHCKVIFLSAKNKEKISKRIQPKLYVVKPFSVKKLVNKFRFK
jgi:CheY-like chemotaxis protein